MRDGFIFHFENIEDIEDMTLEEQGMILQAMISYAKTGKEPEFEDRALRAAWKPIRRRLRDDIERYEAACEKNRENGLKGGRPSKKENPTVIEEDTKNPTVSDENPENPTVILENPEKPKKANTESDTDTESDIEIYSDAQSAAPYAEIIAYLNEKAGTSFRSNAKEAVSKIRARWKEGYRLDDFKTVIDKKVEEWGSDPKMVAFLRPITLFSTKFESYLQQPRAKPKNAFHNYEQRDDDLDELERQLDMQFADMTEPRERREHEEI